MTLISNSAAEVVPLANLIASPDIQPRSRTDPATVHRYAQAMRAGATFPPIVVANVNGVLMLLDGFHRAAAMKTLDIVETRADVREVSSLEEARWLAGKANLAHGLPLKARERRDVFRAYVRAGEHMAGGRRGRLKSYREMATELGGLAHNTVRNWMAADFPRVYARMRGVEGAAPGGLPPHKSLDRLLAKEASEALDTALAAALGVRSKGLRERLLEKVEAMRLALVGADIGTPEEDLAPFVQNEQR